MNPDEADALRAFDRLGLTGYEAKVSVALERLGSDTARDLGRTGDVPRSRRLPATEIPDERRSFETRRSHPIRRPASVDEARDTPCDRFETDHGRETTGGE